MARFTTLPETGIRGIQLADEIEQATGLDVGAFDVIHYQPNEVEVIGVPAAQVAAVQAVIDAHAPDPLYFPADVEAARKVGAYSKVQAIPGWASWDEAQTLAWVDDNVTDLASAKTAIKAMARLLVALRNETWPGLEGS